MKMMKSMGYKPEHGLGSSAQGRLEPIEVATQNGRHGFGLYLDGIDQAAKNWNPSMEAISLREPFKWLKSQSDDLKTITPSVLREWAVEGPKKLAMDEETIFCDALVLANILEHKSMFDQLGAREMQNARERCNPFETIGRSIFMNRAAVKMANIDFLLEFMLTSPKNEDGSPMVTDGNVFHFADCCAGPGKLHFEFKLFFLYSKWRYRE